MRHEGCVRVAIAVGALVTLAACGGRINDGADGGPHDGGAADADGAVPSSDGGTTPKDTGTPTPEASTCNFTICSGLCVDTATDPGNCGQCKHVCPGGSICANGACVCSGGLTQCGNACVDTSTDDANCGGCGLACSTTCVNGTCPPQTQGPPQGNCSHSLCDSSAQTALVGGCDPSGCVTTICNADVYCCATSWDDICVNEVATYCPPYSCP